MTFVELFCGVGGFRLGLERVGMKCVYANDIDSFCKKTYDANFSEPSMDCRDIWDNKEFSPADMIVAGFPCQAFSVAGKREGFDDPRVQVFFRLVEVIREVRPKWLLLENVKNILTHNNGKTFEKILQPLEELGYDIRHQVLNACSHRGVPQNREGVFIIGRSILEGLMDNFNFPIPIETPNIRDFLDDKVEEKYYYLPESKIYPKLEEAVKNLDVVYQYRRHYVRENKKGICPTLTANLGTGGHNVPIILTRDGRIRKLTPREVFRLQGFPEDYRLICSDAQSYKQAGNSVCVNIVETLGKEILRIEHENDTPAFIPEPVELGEYVVISRRKNGSILWEEKINVSLWRESEIEALMDRCMRLLTQ